LPSVARGLLGKAAENNGRPGFTPGLPRAPCVPLLGEAEVGGVVDAVADVEIERLAGGGISLRRLPVELVGAPAKVLQPLSPAAYSSIWSSVSPRSQVTP
jgi:hypothetical protein